MSEKLIFHVDVNSAFLSWEAVRRLKEGDTNDLRDIPSAIGGDLSKRHGIILAKSIPAKKYGIVTGEPVVNALKKCPGLYLAKPDFTTYNSYSKAFISILNEYSPSVEQLSIDEAFMDMSGMELIYPDPVKTAHELKDRIRNELGFTVNVGISSNRLLAKMASDFKKPDLVHTLFKDEIEKKMWHLPVNELFFVGKSTAARLNELGIKTIGELAAQDIEIMKANFKKHGEVIWNFANGNASSIIENEETATKEYGNSTTIPFDVTDEATAKMVILSLSEHVAERLRKSGVKAESVSVSIKDSNFKRFSHQTVLKAPTNITEEIYKAACRLFDEMWDGIPIRLLGVSTSKIRNDADGRQMSLFDNTDYEKLERLDRAMDSIRSRFGQGAVKRASFLKEENKDYSPESYKKK